MYLIKTPEWMTEIAELTRTDDEDSFATLEEKINQINEIILQQISLQGLVE